MPISYTNRKGQKYFLHKRKDKAGKIRYHCSLKSEGDLATAVPEGFEIYEHPSGKVYCRRIPRQIIRSEEKAAIEYNLKLYTDLDSFLIDVTKNMIVVYTPNVELDDFDQILVGLSRGLSADNRQEKSRYVDYEAAMRFVLVGKKERAFVAQRFCYLGSIDDWIDISEPGKLVDLARVYLPHLGKDSYFDLHLYS